jgi:hypothetical protein
MATDDYDIDPETGSGEQLETTGPAPVSNQAATPTYKYYNDKYQEVHLVQSLSVPDDETALEYFSTVFFFFDETHPDARVKYVAVKRPGENEFSMLAYEYDCDEDKVYTLGRAQQVVFVDEDDEPVETVVTLPEDDKA